MGWYHVWDSSAGSEGGRGRELVSSAVLEMEREKALEEERMQNEVRQRRKLEKERRKEEMARQKEEEELRKREEAEEEGVCMLYTPEYESHTNKSP